LGRGVEAGSTEQENEDQIISSHQNGQPPQSQPPNYTEGTAPSQPATRHACMLQYVQDMVKQEHTHNTHTRTASPWPTRGAVTLSTSGKKKKKKRAARRGPAHLEVGGNHHTLRVEGRGHRKV
jgi:hypothetical protein